MLDKIIRFIDDLIAAMIELYHDTCGEIDGPDFPQEVVDTFARYLLPIIQKFYTTEDGQAQYLAWKEQQEKNKPLTESQ